MKNITIMAIIISFAIGGGGGYMIGKNQMARDINTWQDQARTGSMTGGTRLGPGQNRGNLFRPLQGEIVSLDENGITIETEDGSTKIILTSKQTSYSQTSEAGRDSLKTGDKIGVFGNPNQDGSVSAQNIQINPAYRMPGVGRTGSPYLENSN